MLHATSPLHYDYDSPRFTVTPTNMYDLPVTGFLPSCTAFPFFQWKTEAWRHIFWLAVGSRMCVHVQEYVRVDVCVCVCVYIFPHLFFCCTCQMLGDLCKLFPWKKLLMPFLPMDKWRQSQVQSLAWQVAILMIL